MTARGWRRRAAVGVAMVALVAVVLALPVPATASGTAPVGYPNPTNPLVPIAASAAKNTTSNAYAETVLTTYNVTPAEQMPSAYGNTWVLTNLTQHVTQAKGKAASLGSAETWFNYTGPIGAGATGGGFGTSGTATGAYGSEFAWSVSSLTLTVTDESTTALECGANVGWGDGSSGTAISTHGTATHTYSVAGSYAVSLTVSVLISGHYECLPYTTAGTTVSLGVRPIAECALQSTTASFRGCEGTLTCDGLVVYTPDTYQQPPKTVSVPRYCFSLYLNWSTGSNNATGYGQAVLGQPSFTITRAATLVFAQSAAWGAVGTDRDQENSAVGFLGDSAFFATSTLINNTGPFCHFTPASGATVYCDAVTSSSSPEAIAVAQAAWWVPYPAGNWDLSSTLITEADTNTAVPLSNATITQSAILLEWSNFPVVSANVTQHYSFSLLSLTPLGTTGPPGSEIVLTLGNVSAGAPFYSASATWENYASGTFNGTFYLQGSWLNDATGIALYANGALVPSYEYLYSGASITVYSGYVPVGSQATVSFVAHFTPNPQFSLTAPLFYADGVPVTLWSLIVLGGVLASGFVVYANVERGPRPAAKAEGHSTAGLILSIMLFASALAVLVSL